MTSAKQGPLTGIRIIDHCSHWAGPLATSILGGLGAEVVKVEAIQRYDGARMARICVPGPDGHEWSAAFNGYNHEKLGFTVNLADPRGHEVFLDLVRSSDVMVESYRPDAAAKLGIGGEQLLAINPKLIYVNLSGFGNQGPWAGRPGYGATFSQLSGFSYAYSYAGAAPQSGGGGTTSYSDVFNAAVATYSILTALRHRDTTGRGQLIEQAQVEVTALMGLPYLMDYALNGEILQPDGNRRPGPENIYPCASGGAQTAIPARATALKSESAQQLVLDEWIAIDVNSDDEWQALARVAGGAPFASDGRFRTLRGRIEHRDELDRLLGDWTKDQNASDLAVQLQQAGVRAAAVANQAQAMANTHFHDRGDIGLIERSITGAHLYVNFPFHFEQPVSGWSKGSPTLGEDNHVVLHDILGLSEEAIAELEAREVIGQRPVWHPVT